jgi:atypical dual specificity phosphatase
MPIGFSWVDAKSLAALAMPDQPEDFSWLRQQGISVLISLTEWPPPKAYVNEAGLMNVHIPIPDMTAPTTRQLEHALEVIERAQQSGLGVAVHCAAGRGRTGTVLAAYFVRKGLSAEAAIQQVRQLRPGSIETPEQEQAVREWAKLSPPPAA